MTSRQHLHLIIGLVAWGLVLALLAVFTLLGKALS